MRDKILRTALNHVPEYGWTRQAVIKACTDLNMPSIANGMVENVPLALLDGYQSMLLDGVRSKYAKKSSATFYENLNEILSIRQELSEPFASRLSEAIQIRSQPPHIPSSIASLHDISHQICLLASDDSFNMRWYSRRIAVGGILTSSELFMTQDESRDFSSTLEYVRSRIRDAELAELASTRVEQMATAGLFSLQTLLGSRRL